MPNAKLLLGPSRMLNAKTQAEFRGLIETRLREIDAENKLGRGGQAIVELDQQAVGRLSRMDALQNQAMSKAQNVRRQQETQRLHSALHRLETGEYGQCEDCLEYIPLGRLRLDLCALRCVSCASG